MQFKKTETLSRQDAAVRLRKIAEALAAGDEFDLESGGETLKMDVGYEVSFELEAEVESGKRKLEVEITWSPAAEAAEAFVNP